MTRARFLLAALLLVAIACSSRRTGGSVGGDASEAGPSLDATAQDAAREAKVPDATTPDAAIDAGLCDAAVCRLPIRQCGCPSDQACYLQGGAAACLPFGSADNAEPCSGDNDCRIGWHCQHVSPTQRLCSRFCEEDRDCALLGGLCIEGVSSDFGQPVEDVMRCSLECDPTAEAACPGGVGCHIFADNGNAERVFAECNGTVGTTPSDGACTSNADCAAGLGCFMVGQAQQCLAYCTLGGSDCSLASCTDVGHPTYGVCI